MASKPLVRVISASGIPARIRLQRGTILLAWQDGTFLVKVKGETFILSESEFVRID